MSRKRIQILLSALVVVGAGLGIKLGRYHLVPKRFKVVEPGRIYRGGEQQAGPYRRIVEEFNIRTVVTLLNEEPDDPIERIEAELVKSLGVKRFRFPMPGDGRGTLDALDGAAAALADADNHPVFVHCSAGVHRTGASIAAYRMKYCGWDYDRAMGELAENWVSPAGKPELFEHLKTYYAERVLGAARPADVSAGDVPDG